MRARRASTSSTGESWRDRISLASSVAGVKQSPSLLVIRSFQPTFRSGRVLRSVAEGVEAGGRGDGRVVGVAREVAGKCATSCRAVWLFRHGGRWPHAGGGRWSGGRPCSAVGAGGGGAAFSRRSRAGRAPGPAGRGR